jgi:hypothetical protein
MTWWASALDFSLAQVNRWKNNSAKKFASGCCPVGLLVSLGVFIG